MPPPIQRTTPSCDQPGAPSAATSPFPQEPTAGVTATTATGTSEASTAPQNNVTTTVQTENSNTNQHNAKASKTRVTSVANATVNRFAALSTHDSEEESIKEDPQKVPTTLKVSAKLVVPRSPPRDKGNDASVTSEHPTTPIDSNKLVVREPMDDSKEQRTPHHSPGSKQEGDHNLITLSKSQKRKVRKKTVQARLDGSSVTPGAPQDETKSYTSSSSTGAGDHG